MLPNDQIHVLVIDDDQDFTTMLCKQFKALGFSCDGATSVSEAYVLLGKPLAPDLVVVDLELIDGKGTEIIGILTQPRFAHTKTIVISGSAYAPQHRLDNFKVDQVLLKPVNPRSLGRLARHLLGIKNTVAH